MRLFRSTGWIHRRTHGSGFRVLGSGFRVLGLGGILVPCRDLTVNSHYFMLMARIENFQDLEIWQLAREICRDVYTLFLDTSLRNDFALRNQMDKSSGSIMDNIAEGFERNGNKEFIQYLSIAKASCGELRSQLFRAVDRKHIDKPRFDQLIEKLDLECNKIGFLMSYPLKSGYKGSKLNR